MAKTLAQLRTTTRMYLDEVSQKDWTNAQIDEQLNFKYMQMYAAVVETYEDFYYEEFLTDLETDQQKYQMPDRTFKIRRLEVKYKSDDDAGIKAIPFDFEQLRRASTDSTYQTTARPLYDIIGNYIRLLPIPTEDVTDGLRGFFIREVEELSDDTDEIDIPFPNRYAFYLPVGAAAELLRKGQQEEAVAAKYDMKFEQGLEIMKQELANRTSDGSKMILDTQGDRVDFETFVVY